MKFFKKAEIRFGDLDTPYQNHFIKEFILTGICFIVALIFCIAVKRWLYILGVFAITFGYSIYLLSQIYKSLSGKVVLVDAKCIDLERKENKLLGSMSKEGTTSKTCTLILENEDGLKFKQAVGYSSPYKTGDIVRIYANDGSISQLNQNTYTVINPIFMHVLKS